MSDKKLNIHAGHRERLRTRYKRCGFDDFQPHEVLELLLFNSIPRANTNPIAHNLLNHFGSLYDVLFARYDDLLEVEGVGPASAALICQVGDTVRAAKLKEIGAASLTSWDKLYLYCTEWFAGKLKGTVAVLLLDSKRKVITVKTLAEEHLRRPMDFPTAILKSCLQQDAKYAVLMHNHADGIMLPSEEDLVLTREIYKLLQENGISLLEHMIVGKLDAVPCLNTAMNKDVSGFPQKNNGEVDYEAAYLSAFRALYAK